MIDILALPFMQRALIAALLSGLIAPAIGTFIVQKRMSLLGDGLGHVAIMGVGLAMLTGWAPLPVAVVVCVTGAVIVELLRQNRKIEAIKLWREATGLGLAESKAAVEALERRRLIR